MNGQQSGPIADRWSFKLGCPIHAPSGTAFSAFVAHSNPEIGGSKIPQRINSS
jgi:hypothetical protein